MRMMQKGKLNCLLKEEERLETSKEFPYGERRESRTMN